MGLLERAHKPFTDALRKLGGHAVAEWVDFIGTVISWRNSSMNRDIGMSPHEALLSRKSTFAYDRLGLADITPVTPNELDNLSSSLDVCIRTCAAVSSALVAAQYDHSRAAPPSFTPGDHVLIHFPDRTTKSLTYYRGPFIILYPCDSGGNYFHVRDCIQFNEYDVHVERIKPFDMSRTSLEEQAERQLPSRDFGIVVAVDAHRMNDTHGLFEFCVRFYSGYRAWQLFSSVSNLDVVKAYVELHKLNTRKQTPAQQYLRLTGQSPTAARPAPNRSAPSPVAQSPKPDAPRRTRSHR